MANFYVSVHDFFGQAFSSQTRAKCGDGIGEAFFGSQVVFTAVGAHVLLLLMWRAGPARLRQSRGTIVARSSFCNAKSREG